MYPSHAYNFRNRGIYQPTFWERVRAFIKGEKS